MFKKSIILILIVAIVCLLSIILKPKKQEDFVTVGAQSAYDAPEIGTKFEPMKQSMAYLLGQLEYRVVATSKTPTGMIMTLERTPEGIVGEKKDSAVCFLELPNPKKKQYSSTSRCWSLN